MRSYLFDGFGIQSRASPAGVARRERRALVHFRLSTSTDVIRIDAMEQLHRMITSNLLLTSLLFFAWFDPELRC